MIERMYLKRKPFAICIDTIQIQDSECLDMFVVIPRYNPRVPGIKIKGFQSVADVEMTKQDREWFMKHKDLFHLAMKSDEGRVYQPNYCCFKEEIRIRQRTFEF